MDLSVARGQARSAGTATRKKFDKALWWIAAIPLSVLMILLAVIGITNTVTSPSETQVANTTPPARYTNVNAPAEALYPYNTNNKCTGMQRLMQLTEENIDFNPFGCYVYWKPGVVGTVTLVGITIIGLPASRDISAGHADPGAWTAYKARAKMGTGRAAWQPVLCIGPKKNLATNDCA